MGQYLAIQDILNAVFQNGSFKGTLSSQDVINAVYDSEKAALRVNVEGGAGMKVVDKLPESGSEGDMCAVTDGNYVSFYQYKEGAWRELEIEDASVKADGDTIIENSDSALQAAGVKETNVRSTVRFWIGTKAEYEQQHKEQSRDVCFVTDDDSATYVDESLDGNSPNPVANAAVTKALEGSLDSLSSALAAKLGVTITKTWNQQKGCWEFEIAQ
ncbi:MAG: hypothetical protein J6Y62_03730 [Clostridia bacterium]|nr:hypothetical protein [Clostridia bacterium]